jgi:hypothetical protein
MPRMFHQMVDRSHLFAFCAGSIFAAAALILWAWRGI